MDTKIASREAAGRRLSEALDRAGMKQSELAQRIGTTRGAVSAWIVGRNEMSRSNCRTVAGVLGVASEWLSTGDGPIAAPMTDSGQTMVSEGEKTDPARLPAEISRTLISALVGMRGECWRLTTDNLAAAQYFRGDYVIVDLDRPAKARDIVLAETPSPLFRLFLPPYLLTAGLDAAPAKHLVVDNIRIIIRGVVVGKHSFS